MEWRCEWCGKPHEEDDPPCDNCGHGTFEKAVVPVAGDESDLGSKATVWVCEECGREHTKHTPPCSRCGNETLVQQRQEITDDELNAPGYLDLLTPAYAVGLVAVLGLAALFILGVTGVVSLPGFGNSVPTVSDVPGDAETTGDVSLATVEQRYLEELDETRTAAGTPNLTRDERLGEIATFVNQRIVKAEYGDGERPSSERLRELLSESCSGPLVAFTQPLDAGRFTSATGIAEAFASRATAENDIETQASKIGVDAHTTPDGMVYLTQIAC